MKQWLREYICRKIGHRLEAEGAFFYCGRCGETLTDRESR